jgi:AcrR family transcriptional regulator
MPREAPKRPPSAERRRGRPPTIDRAAVLDTAIRLLDAEGVEALTMRRLAGELGVSAMAPYRYVGSKDELLMVLVDRLAARLEYPPRPRDPKRAIVVLWSTIYDSLAEHPWVPEVLARRRLMAPSVLGAIEEIHAALCDAGLSIDAAARAYRLMWNFTLGSLLVRAGASAEAPSRQRELRGAPDPERYPMLAAAAAAWKAADARDTYREDLGALIDALLAGAATAARPRPRAGSRGRSRSSPG